MAEAIIAYSYVRYSHIKQEEGDSIRRQTERAAAYAARRGWTLDGSLKADRGVSAFHGKNALVGHLSAFLGDIEAGRVKRGSALIVENVDRISRQGIDEGYDVCKRILKAGIILVTLSPEREYDISATKSLTRGALELQLILERAAEESQTKSDRVGAAWAEKKKEARATRAIWQRIFPAWCKKDGVAIVLDPVKADAVRRIFALACEGYGGGAIARRLNEDLVPAIGTRLIWVRGTVLKYLRDRRVLGECQPMKGRPGVPDGLPIPNYFPRIVSDESFYAARAGAAERAGKGRGRPARDGQVNLFQGILRDARDHSNVVLNSQQDKRRNGDRYHVLVSAKGAQEQLGRYVSFPYVPFEDMVLSELAEVDPAEAIGGRTEADYLAGLEGEQKEVKARLDVVQAELYARPSPSLANVARHLDERAQELEALVLAARAQAARPTKGGWDDFKAIVVGRESGSEARIGKQMLRTSIRRIVDEMWVLIVPRKLERWAAAQVFFKDGRRRLYLLYHRTAHNAFGQYTPAGHAVRSWPIDADEALLDLRDPDHVARVEAFLLERPTPDTLDT